MKEAGAGVLVARVVVGVCMTLLLFWPALFAGVGAHEALHCYTGQVLASKPHAPCEVTIRFEGGGVMYSGASTAIPGSASENRVLHLGIYVAQTFLIAAMLAPGAILAGVASVQLTHRVVNWARVVKAEAASKKTRIGRRADVGGQVRASASDEA